MTEKQDVTNVDCAKLVTTHEGSQPSPAPENEKPHGESYSPVSPTLSELSINEEIIEYDKDEAIESNDTRYIG